MEIIFGIITIIAVIVIMIFAMMPGDKTTENSESETSPENSTPIPYSPVIPFFP